MEKNNPAYTSLASVIKKVVSLALVAGIIFAEVLAYIAIDFMYDGCCGAPYRGSANDNIQLLTHYFAYAVGIGLIYLAIWWGWLRTPKNKA